jgi:hypothetical protein
MSRVWRAEWGGDNSSAGLQWMFTLHYQTDLALGEGEPAGSEVVSELLNHWGGTPTNMSILTGVTESPNVFRFLRVREEIDPTSGDVPLQAEIPLSLPGTLTMSGDRLPIEVCMWVKCTTDTASRSSRGGFHLPPMLNPVFLDGGGQWDAASIAAPPFSTLTAKVPDVLDDVFGPIGAEGSLRPIIYSATRRARGFSPYTFDITQARIRQHAAWLRTRGIAP